jgi:hypothetical protein
MTDMVKRVGEAIERAFLDEVANRQLGQDPLGPLAYAAIAAMREPTKAMLDAIPGTQEPQIAEIAAEHWRLMIAAALAPAGQGEGQNRAPKSSDPKVFRPGSGGTATTGKARQ